MIYTDSPRQVLRIVLDYLDSIDDESGKVRRERIETLIGLDSNWENPSAMMDESKAVGLSESAISLRIETEDLITELKVRRPELIKASNEDKYLEAVHYASVARLLLNYHTELAGNSEKKISNLLGMRSAMIADNLVYAVSREQNRGKVLVFAHNQHLKKRTNVQWNLGSNFVEYSPAGAHLCSLFGPQYVTIGAGLGSSEDNGIGEPECGTLESLLTNKLESAMFIPTDTVQGFVNTEISSFPTRSGSTKNGTYFPFTPASIIDIDWFVILKSTRYTRGALPLP
jgi:erythromycin esterase